MLDYFVSRDKQAQSWAEMAVKKIEKGNLSTQLYEKSGEPKLAIGEPASTGSRARDRRHRASTTRPARALAACCGPADAGNIIGGSSLMTDEAHPGRRRLFPDLEEAELLFKALADETRLAILRQLREQGEVCACDFQACCELAQPTVSHHLRVLREAGLVNTEKRGLWVHYTLNEARLVTARALLP